METFDFYLDQKHTIWYRNNFTIEANSQEEANEKVKELYHKDELPSDDWDLLHETVEALSIGDNGGEATEELYTHSGDMILDNIKTN
jgi:hypothetical protein